MSQKTSILCLLVPALAVGCPRSEPTGTLEPVVRQPMPQLAFQIIRANDIGRLSEIVMSSADFVRLMEMQLQRTEAKVDPAEIQARSVKAASACLSKARRSLQKIREMAHEEGIDWSSARLVSVTTARGPFEPSMPDVHLDIFLLIEAGDKRLQIKLDDCFFVNGHRRLADGFRPMRR